MHQSVYTELTAIGLTPQGRGGRMKNIFTVVAPAFFRYN
jgi:hypothetical protein